MKRFIYNNSLSIVFFLLFVGSFIGQIYTGFKHYNQENIQEGFVAIPFITYLQSGHFLQATFENWESEFFQMGLFVILTIWLRQKGSSESKKCDVKEEVDREPNPKRKNTPWPVKKGGIILWIYKRSLSISLFLLFLVSFVIHFYASLKDENEILAKKYLSLITSSEYIWSSRFWFESFQNWQSEFLSMFTIIILSIYLRQKGSPQSKPVDAPHSETGE